MLYPHVNPAIDCTPAIITGPKFEQDLPVPVRKSFPKMLYLKMVKHGVSPFFFTYDSLLECIVAPWKLVTSTILERQSDTFFFQGLFKFKSWVSGNACFTQRVGSLLG